MSASNHIDKQKHITFIVNPKSGASSFSELAYNFKNYLVKSGYKVIVRYTRSLSHAQELSRQAVEACDCAMIIAYGGDGTIREVIHGMQGSDKPLMILPGGTENLLANELGLDENLKTYIKTFEEGFCKKLDLGRVDGRFFTCVMGAGIDGDIVHLFASQREGHISHLDYFWPIWRVFWSHRFPAFKVTADNELVYQGRGMVFVGNISRYAVGLEILKKANYSDGSLDICFLKCTSRLHLVKHALSILLKQHIKCSDVVYRQAKEVVIESQADDVRTEIDGDPGPELPARVSLIHDAVTVMVPQNGKPAGIRTRIKRILGF